MKNTFTEGNLSFTFGESWNVIKYDDHRYYLTLSGSSFSGVDFAGIYNCDQAVFIEVKNYLQYEGPIRDNSEILAKKYGEKITDTLRLIDIVQRYHRRKWWYRTLKSYIQKYPWLHRDWFFWTSLQEMIQDQSKYRFIFLVLCSEQDQKLFNHVLKNIRDLHPNTNVDIQYKGASLIPDLHFNKT